MTLEKTKKQLIDLLAKGDNNVIALSGKWGTGKTHLWNEVKRDSEDDQVKKSLYVSIFGLSTVDQIKRKLMEGALPDSAVEGGRFEVFKNLFKSGVTVAATHYKALAAINDLNLILMAPIVLQKRMIVIDDIERKHEKLGIDEVLGFIDEYSKEFNVRFLLVLNDDQLSSKGEQEKLWTTFREKVIDQEIRLSTSPAEAFSIAIKLWPSKYAQSLRSAVVACGLTNIRIICKVIKATNQILADRELINSIQARVVPSIVLFAAIHYRGLEDGPDFQFALNIADPLRTSILRDKLRDKNKEPTEQEKREDGWRLLIHGMGIFGCGEFEKLLVEFLESGLFEDDQVKATIDRYIAEGQAMESRQRVQAFIKKASWDHRVSDAQLIAEATPFPEIAGQLDPYLATSLYEVLSGLMEGQSLADEFIQAWITAFRIQGGNAADEEVSFGRPLHADIKAVFDESIASAQAQTTVLEACLHIIEHSGWGTMQEVVMKRTTAAEFETAIRNMDVEVLPRFMRRMIQMRLQQEAYEPHFGHAMKRFVEACRSIVNDPSPGSARLSKLVRGLFQNTTLATELDLASATAS